MAEYTAKEVAIWLANEIKRCGAMERSRATQKIEDRFDKSFLTLSEGGQKLIKEQVLRHFRVIKHDSIVWNEGRQAWVSKPNGQSAELQETTHDDIQIPTAVHAQAVPEDAARLRFFTSCDHSHSDLETTVKAIDSSFSELGF